MKKRMKKNINETWKRKEKEEQEGKENKLKYSRLMLKIKIKGIWSDGFLYRMIEGR